MAFELAAFEPVPGSTGAIRVPVPDSVFELTILKDALSTSEEISEPSLGKGNQSSFFDRIVKFD